MIYLALGEFEEAKNRVEMIMTFNENSAERRKYYSALNVLLDIELDDSLSFQNYEKNLKRMYGDELIGLCRKTISNEVKFYGLYEIGSDLSKVDKHQRLIDSYMKLHNKRSE